MKRNLSAKCFALSVLTVGIPNAALGGVDVIVNDPTLDTPEATAQFETTLAVLGKTVCAGYLDTGTPNQLAGLSRSTDLGRTWKDLDGIGQFGDPVIAVHRESGTFYYARLADIGGSAIGVSRSTDDCQTFGHW